MLYIVRHGQTTNNKLKLLQGRSDVPLNDEGRLQAREAGQLLRNMGIKPVRIYSSPLIRAVETARLIAEEIYSGQNFPCSVLVDERLIEMDYGPYEGMDLTSPAPEVMGFFMDFAGTPAPEGMEQLSSVAARTGQFADEIIHEAASSDVIISTHAIAMKGILEYLTPDSGGSYWSKYIGNCEIYAANVVPVAVADTGNDDAANVVPVTVADTGTGNSASGSTAASESHADPGSGALPLRYGIPYPVTSREETPGV